ncbi:MAG TPA: DUF6788 family protein [Solirubrobacteraceae bacterium]|nr:DUF6788 family protein [Solirubrobacteraceae bacterium]
MSKRRPRSLAAIEAHRRRIAAQIAAIDYVLPGSLNVVMNRCGKRGCACHADPPRLHGPYITWTRKVAGKTQTRRLSPAAMERYKPWFDSNRRLQALIAELQELGIERLEAEQRA